MIISIHLGKNYLDMCGMVVPSTPLNPKYIQHIHIEPDELFL